MIPQARYLIRPGRSARPSGCCRSAIDYAKIRVLDGLHPIADYQAIQWKIAGSQVDIESAKWLTPYAAWRVQAGLDARHASSIAKLDGAVMANEGRRPGDADPRRHGLHQGTSRRALVPRAALCGSTRVPTRSSALTIARNLSRATSELGGIGE